MRSLERKKRLKIAITRMFSRRRRRSRARKEWICERRCQVSVSGVVYMYFRDFSALKPFRDYSLCSVCILPQSTFYSQSAFYTQSAFYPWSAVCSLHFTHSLHFTPGPQSAVCSPQSSFYTDRKQYWLPWWRAYSCPPTWQPKLLFACILLNV